MKRIIGAGLYIMLGVLILLTGCASPQLGAGSAQDVPAARAALLRADTHIQMAKNEIMVARLAIADEATPDPIDPIDPPTPPPAAGINLATFAWAGKKAADPAGISAGAKYGEGVEGGRRICQWWYPTFILHAHIIPSTRTSANGSNVVWYHFTTDGKVHPGLVGYGWQNTHQTPSGGVVWYRWARTK